MSPKDIARKISSGCDHSEVIRIPCSGCIERQIITWAASVRDDFRASMKSDWASMVVERDAAKRELDKIKGHMDAYVAKIRKLEIQVGSLTAQLKISKSETEEARVQLHAEQAIKSSVRMASA